MHDSKPNPNQHTFVPWLLQTLKGQLMRSLLLLMMLLIPSISHADWYADLYRLQCIPELAKLDIESFSVHGMNVHADFESTDPHDQLYIDLAKKHETYMVVGNNREHSCSLSDVPLKVSFIFGRNSQGEAWGRVTLTSNSTVLIDDLELFMFYGHRPIVTKIEISSTQNGDIYATLSGTKSTNHPDFEEHSEFSFSKKLSSSEPITQKIVNKEAN